MMDNAKILEGLSKIENTKQKNLLLNEIKQIWEKYVDELHNRKKGKEYTQQLKNLVRDLITLFDSEKWFVRRNVIQALNTVPFSDAVDTYRSQLIDITFKALHDNDGRVRYPSTYLLKDLCISLHEDIELSVNTFFRLEKAIRTQQNKKIRKSLEDASAHMQCPFLDDMLEMGYPEILKFMKIRTKEKDEKQKAFFNKVETMVNEWVKEGRNFSKKVDNIWFEDKREFVDYWINASIFQLTFEQERLLEELNNVSKNKNKYQLNLLLTIVDNRFLYFFDKILNKVKDKNKYCTVYEKGKVKVATFDSFIDRIKNLETDIAPVEKDMKVEGYLDFITQSISESDSRTAM